MPIKNMVFYALSDHKTTLTDQPTRMYLAHTDMWLATAGFFKAGQRVNVSLDYIRQSLTVTPEYDDAAKARERAERTIELKAQSDQLRSVWRAQEAERRQRRNCSTSYNSSC